MVSLTHTHTRFSVVLYTCVGCHLVPYAIIQLYPPVFLGIPVNQ